MSLFANTLISMAEWWASLRHRELRVIIGSDVTVRYEKPGSTDKYGWDETFYAEGMVNVKDCYNPVKIDAKEVEEGDHEYELIPSQNYKAAILATEIIPKALNPINMDHVKLAIYATAGIALVTLFAVAGLYA